jgi:hypothetical protein
MHGLSFMDASSIISVDISRLMVSLMRITLYDNQAFKDSRDALDVCLLFLLGTFHDECDKTGLSYPSDGTPPHHFSNIALKTV